MICGISTPRSAPRRAKSPPRRPSSVVLAHHDQLHDVARGVVVVVVVAVVAVVAGCLLLLVVCCCLLLLLLLLSLCFSDAAMEEKRSPKNAAKSGKWPFNPSYEVHVEIMSRFPGATRDPDSLSRGQSWIFPSASVDSST